jgi:hypothetical protein
MVPADDGEPQELLDSTSQDEWLAVCFPRLDTKDRSELIEMLETEYLHLLPMIEFNNPADQPMARKNS